MRLISISIWTLVCFAGVAHAGENSWSARGPFGGAVWDVVFDPTNSSQVYAAAGPSLFRSIDGGQTWNELSHDFGDYGIADLEFDPSNPARLYVASYERGLLVTTDAADTFTRVGPEPIDPNEDGPYRIAISANGQAIYYFTLASKLVSSTDGGVTFTEQYLSSFPRALAISPTDSAVLYVATSAGVIKTSDSGVTWDDLPHTSEHGSWVESIAIVPGSPHQLWIATQDNVFSTQDDGQPWTAFAPVLPQRKLQQDPSDPTRLYVTNLFGQYEPIRDFHDGSWTVLPDFKDQVYAVAASPTDPSLIIIAARTGIWRSTNGGIAWNRFNAGFTASDMRAIAAGPGVIYAGTFPGELVRSVGDADFETASLPSDFPLSTSHLGINMLAVQPSNANVVVAATSRGVMTSHDAGESWSSGSAEMNAWVIDAVTFDPSNATTVYAAGMPLAGDSPRLQRSEDAGLTFTPVNDDLPLRIGHIAVDPHDSNRLFGAGSPAFFDPEAQGLWRSEDAGATWTKIHENAGTNDIAVHLEDADVIYAVLGDGSVLMSDDGGDSFESTFLPLNPFGTPLKLALDPESSNVLYVLASNDTGGSSSEYHIMRSVDRGRSWERIPNATANGWIPNDLIVDLEEPTVLHAATRRGVHSYEITTDVSAAILGHIGDTQFGIASSFEVQLASEGPFAATGVSAEIQLAGAVQIDSATIENGSCTVSDSVVTCSAPFVQTTAPVTVLVSYTPTAAGAVDVQATAQAREHDPATANNSAAATASFTAPAPPPPPPPTSGGGNSGGGGGGGGGGSASLPLLLALHALAVAVRARRRRRRS